MMSSEARRRLNWLTRGVFLPAGDLKLASRQFGGGEVGMQGDSHRDADEVGLRAEQRTASCRGTCGRQDSSIGSRGWWKLDSRISGSDRSAFSPIKQVGMRRDSRPKFDAESSTSLIADGCHIEDP